MHKLENVLDFKKGSNCANLGAITDIVSTLLSYQQLLYSSLNTMFIFVPNRESHLAATLYKFLFCIHNIPLFTSFRDQFEETGYAASNLH